MSFRNPIVAGNNLVRNAIQSPNYLAGSMGWIIRRDGSAEFSNAIFRGSVVISGSNNLLMYSGAPASGDLVIALAPNAGSDAFGNVYAQGLTIGAAGGSQLVLGLTGGSPLLYFPTGRTAITNSSAFQTITLGTGTGAYDQLQILGAQDNTQLDAIDSGWTSSSPDGTQPAQILDFYHDPSGGYHFYRVCSFAGNASTGPVTAVQPGTGTSRAVPAVAETWHAGASLLTALWTTTGASNPLRYRLEPQGSGGGCVRLDGEILTTGAGPWPANATMFSLPAGYHPAQSHPFITRSDIAVAAGQCTVNVLNSGGVQNGQAFTAAGQRLWFDDVVFPLD